MQGFFLQIYCREQWRYLLQRRNTRNESSALCNFLLSLLQRSCPLLGWKEPCVWYMASDLYGYSNFALQYFDMLEVQKNVHQNKWKQGQRETVLKAKGMKRSEWRPFTLCDSEFFSSKTKPYKESAKSNSAWKLEYFDTRPSTLF